MKQKAKDEYQRSDQWELEEHEKKLKEYNSARLQRERNQPHLPDFNQYGTASCGCEICQRAYANIAREMGWVSPAGNIKTGAEFAHRYCSGDYSFIEDHTALSDARIETFIMAECFKLKKRVPYGKINGAPWRLVNKNAGEDANVHGSKVA